MVYDVNEIDDKVSAFTGTIQLILDKILPKHTIRFHPSDKPWMTTRIKQEIKARQKAFTSGNKSRYKILCDRAPRSYPTQREDTISR